LPQPGAPTSPSGFQAQPATGAREDDIRVDRHESLLDANATDRIVSHSDPDRDLVRCNAL
jgi:hypothetical protein